MKSKVNILMANDNITNNVYFWLSITTAGIGAIHLLLRYINKSRCRSCKCCGILVLERELEDQPTRNDTDSI